MLGEVIAGVVELIFAGVPISGPNGSVPEARARRVARIIYNVLFWSLWALLGAALIALLFTSRLVLFGVLAGLVFPALLGLGIRAWLRMKHQERTIAPDK